MANNAACVSPQGLEAGGGPTGATVGETTFFKKARPLWRSSPHVSQAMGDPLFNPIPAARTPARPETGGGWDSSAEALSEGQGCDLPAHPLKVCSVTSRTG